MQRNATQRSATQRKAALRPGQLLCRQPDDRPAEPNALNFRAQRTGGDGGGGGDARRGAAWGGGEGPSEGVPVVQVVGAAVVEVDENTRGRRAQTTWAVSSSL